MSMKCRDRASRNRSTNYVSYVDAQYQVGPSVSFPSAPDPNERGCPSGLAIPQSSILVTSNDVSWSRFQLAIVALFTFGVDKRQQDPDGSQHPKDARG